MAHHVRVTLGEKRGKKKKLCSGAASKSHLLGLQKYSENSSIVWDFTA